MFVNDQEDAQVIFLECCCTAKQGAAVHSIVLQRFRGELHSRNVLIHLRIALGAENQDTDDVIRMVVIV